jgi:hypothetical protein
MLTAVQLTCLSFLVTHFHCVQRHPLYGCPLGREVSPTFTYCWGLRGPSSAWVQARRRSVPPNGTDPAKSMEDMSTLLYVSILQLTNFLSFHFIQFLFFSFPFLYNIC